MSPTDLQNAITLINQLSAEDQRTLLRTLQDRHVQPDETASPDWKLAGAQLAFVLQHRVAIEAAYARDDMGFLDALEASEEYQSLFTDMPWDEAYDRFEETWWVDEGSDAA